MIRVLFVLIMMLIGMTLLNRAAEDYKNKQTQAQHQKLEFGIK